MVLAKARTILKLVSLASWGEGWGIEEQGLKKKKMNNELARIMIGEEKEKKEGDMLMMFEEKKNKDGGRGKERIKGPSNSIKNGFSEGE